MYSRVVFGLIIFIAFILRIWKIDVVPFGFTPDEASFGYDAYSIIHTGRDQWGQYLPIILKSFGDFKPPLYSYLAIPSIAFLGLNVFSTRLPNAILGTLAVVATFFMIHEWMVAEKASAAKEKTGKDFYDFKYLPLISSFFLAVNSWHVMLSRGAFESALTVFFMPVGIYLFLKFLNSKNVWFGVLSSLSFGLNLFSYHSARLATPLILTVLVILFRKELFIKEKSYFAYRLIFPAIIFLLFLGLSLYTLTIGGLKRAEDINIFAGSVQQASEERFPYVYQGLPDSVAKIFVNKFVISFRRFFSNYSQYFSPKFLFIDGPSEATYGMIPGIGVLYLFEFPLLLVFVYLLMRSEGVRRLNLFLSWWVVLAVIPSALASGQGYAGNRAATMLPALVIMSAIGAIKLNLVLLHFLRSFPRALAVKMLGIFYALVLSFSICYFLLSYFLVSPYKNSKAMLWGNLEAARWLSDNTNLFDKAYVSRRLSEPHIYIAFASAWDPEDYQKNVKNWDTFLDRGYRFLDQMESYSLGKFTFENLGSLSSEDRKNAVFVGAPQEFPAGTIPIVKFVRPDGQTAVMIAK
jgi:hypothetical protein